MKFDDLDVKILKENFDDESISQIDIDNVSNIFKYLSDNGVYYARDLLLSSLDLFLLPVADSILSFVNFNFRLGIDFVVH